jgi:hypothetical protein
MIIMTVNCSVHGSIRRRKMAEEEEEDEGVAAWGCMS